MIPKKKHFFFAAIALCWLFTKAIATQSTIEPADPQPDCPTHRILKNPELAPYHGWIKYLSTRALLDGERFGASSEQANLARKSLGEWTSRIESEPHAIETLRGPVEWAYLSRTDESGQPFQLNIPTDYAPEKAMPLYLYAHGYSGNHMEHSQYQPLSGRFEMSILGRARGGFYVGLSETDVLEALAYVRKHWNIDPTRIHLFGASMGGWASFRFGARYPDIWASIRPICGFATVLPMSNLIDLPIYMTHSDDDSAAPIVEVRGPIQHLKQLGGMIVCDETTGYGHAAWNYGEGNARGGLWESRQVRRDPQEVRRIDFTATDGMATGAWWTRITRWGKAQTPARFVLNALPDNSLYIQVKNIDELELDLQNSPVNRSQDLHISVNSGLFFKHPAPLPERLSIGNQDGTWNVFAQTGSSKKLHTPGGWTQVFDGSKLLIVYGTQGTPIENEALLRAAIAASKSPNCSWPSDDYDRSNIDQVSHLQNLYGNLPIKADKDVTESDLEQCNLVLIGTETQNAIVARLAPGLPVRFREQKIFTDRGQHFPGVDTALALVYRNPQFPQRNLLWFASEDLDFYQQGAPLPELLKDRGEGVDFVVSGSTDHHLYATGYFDSDWQWIRESQDDLLVPAKIQDSHALGDLIADAYKASTGADFGISAGATNHLLFPAIALIPVTGTTTLGDVARLYYGKPIYKLQLSGTDLKKLNLANRESQHRILQFSSDFEANTLENDKTYSLAFIREVIYTIVGLGILPQSCDWTGILAKDAILSYGKQI